MAKKALSRERFKNMLEDIQNGKPWKTVCNKYHFTDVTFYKYRTLLKSGATIDDLVAKYEVNYKTGRVPGSKQKKNTGRAMGTQLPKGQIGSSNVKVDSSGELRAGVNYQKVVSNGGNKLLDQKFKVVSGVTLSRTRSEVQEQFDALFDEAKNLKDGQVMLFDDFKDGAAAYRFANKLHVQIRKRRIKDIKATKIKDQVVIYK